MIDTAWFIRRSQNQQFFLFCSLYFRVPFEMFKLPGLDLFNDRIFQPVVRNGFLKKKQKIIYLSLIHGLGLTKM